MGGRWGRKGPRRDEERRRIATRLLDQGVSVRTVAAQLGVSATWVAEFQRRRAASTEPDHTA